MAHPRTNATKNQVFLRSQSVKATAIPSADVVSVPAGAIGTIKNFALAYHPICNAAGTDIGGEGDTSIAISAGDVFTTLVGYKDDADLAAGEFWVNHLTGQGRGKKATTNTTITLTYNIFSSANINLGGLNSAPIQASTATPANVASSASNVTLLAANANRKGATFFNDSTQVLYLKFGATATVSSYTVQIAAGGYYELPTTAIYTGIIDGIWAAANGNCRVTSW